jgi:hypothetical protein
MRTEGIKKSSIRLYKKLDKSVKAIGFLNLMMAVA